MVGTGLARKQDPNGYAALAQELRTAIAAGKIPAGETLLPTRELGRRYRVSPETARRAVKALEGEGLVVSVPRHGYRVQAHANDPDRGLPVAFVVSGAREFEFWGSFNRMLFAGLQQAAGARGWSLLAVGAEGRPAAAIRKQLQDCRVCGLILDTENEELLAECKQLGLPAVMMDSWDASMRLDAVVQDGFQGSLQAVRFLIERGHTRIGWLGPELSTCQNLERYAGAQAGMAAAGLRVHNDLCVHAPWKGMEAAARRLLGRKDRPTAVLGLWHDAIRRLVQVADERKLRQGRDIEFVGWSLAEDYENTYCSFFPAGHVPPTMVWELAELARMTINRLFERRQEPGLAPALLKVPARLRLPGDVCGRRNRGTI
jgi:DNA-binding LacI/PurR family transcriptional regulator